ncbi:hypothetical protein L484_020355 [Morus notabilis]|uniref:Polygalacturonase n=1 Tax=Morus notabilis TaxID=981085 RepID=W9RF54_9ROSA|nr:hypothetical protein L484_020355 [Morus notabilis]
MAITSHSKLVKVVVSLILFMMMSSSFQLSHAAYVFNVIRYGAKADGKTDSTKAFLRAWGAACGSRTAATVHVPKGNFLIKAAVFRGPCRERITVQIDGTLVAPSNYWALGNSGYWILFIKVNRLAVYGGTLDANGSAFWACRRLGKNCPVGARVSVAVYI